MGHFFPPFSIFFTPALAPIIIAGINIKLYKINFPLTVLYGYGLLVINDVLIRKFAGGEHDNEGRAIIFLVSSIAFGLSVAFMLFYSFTLVNKLESKKRWPILINLTATLVIGFIIAISYYYAVRRFDL